MFKMNDSMKSLKNINVFIFILIEIHTYQSYRCMFVQQF